MPPTSLQEGSLLSSSSDALVWTGSLTHDPGPPGRFTKIKPVNDWPPERSRPPSCLPSQTQKCRAGHGEWRRLPLSFQEQPGLTSSR